jgi:TolB-like protein
LLVASLVGVAPAPAEVIAMLPVQNRAGDRPATSAVTVALRSELESRGEVVTESTTRDALRRLRVRNGDAASPEVLRGLAAELAADWLVSSSVHDAERRDVPRLAISIRAYRGATGELLWSGFEGCSGLDSRKALGLGAVSELEALAPRVVKRLSEGFGEATGAAGPGSSRTRGAAPAYPGSVAIVPFASTTRRRAALSAETVTEAARAVAIARGIRTVSPNCASDVLRRQGEIRWGAVDAPTRTALRTNCGADLILTGKVEVYDVGGAQLEPEPRVTVAMRLVDAESGRIVWTGAAEREGWDRSRLFRAGRIHSRGELAERLLDDLTKSLLRELAAPERRSEEMG